MLILPKKVQQTKDQMAAGIYSVTRTLFYDQQRQQFHNAQGPSAINSALVSQISPGLGAIKMFMMLSTMVVYCLENMQQ